MEFTEFFWQYVGVWISGATMLGTLGFIYKGRKE